MDNSVDWYSLAGLVILILGVMIAYIGSREDDNDDNKINHNCSPTLRVEANIVDKEGNEQTMEMNIESNDMVEAKRIFRKSCIEKDYELLDDPSVSIESN